MLRLAELGAMGRHTPERAGVGVLRPLLVAAAILVIAGATFAIRAAIASGDSSDAATTSSTSPSATQTTTEPATEETTSEAASDEPTEEPTQAQPPTELAACQDEVAAGESLAEAAALSAEHWNIHTQAQVRWQDGEISLEEAREDWAATKALGPDDVERFAQESEAYDAVYGGCEELAAVSVEADLQEQVDACVARGEALNAVAAWGEAVNSDWSAHLDFMETRPGADEVEYVEDWEEQVGAAPENYEPYLDAVADLEDAPECPAS